MVYRMKWQLIRALQMFVEHVILKHEGMLPYSKRLHLVSTKTCNSCRSKITAVLVIIIHCYEMPCLPFQHLRHDADFLKASTVDRVKKHLNSMHNKLKGELKYARPNIIVSYALCL